MPKNKQVRFVWGHQNMMCAKFDEYLIKCMQKKYCDNIEHLFLGHLYTKYDYLVYW